ncbi:MAG TPA: rRNA maturation RNase YbeY [Candidatus Alistipes merdigallinarum]|nr:rRNA maturation RNase YbeY [Candidatus Alistipes merdigallinarum]
MPINYYTDDCTFTYRGKIKTAKWIQETTHSEGWKCGTVSIVFCSDARMLEINNKYLNHNYLTDIITFDYDNPDKKTISGDLMIGIDTVRDNAELFGVPFENELHRVIIHGILHLCGYEDKTPEAEQQMRELENRYLSVLYNSSSENRTKK